jgi:hypothetical protein
VVASQISPLHQREREESQLPIRGNPQNRICKEIALQWPKTGKFDYLSALYQPAHSRGSEFFTDDLLGGHKLGGLPRKERRPDQSLQQAIEAVRAQLRTLPFAALINAKH